MHKPIISDTSCLILLEKIGELELLQKLFGVIVTTQEVADEFGLSLPSWIEIKTPSDKNINPSPKPAMQIIFKEAVAIDSIAFITCFLKTITQSSSNR